MTTDTSAVDRRTAKLFQKLAAVTRQVERKAAPERVHQLRTTVRRIETLTATHGLGGHRGVSKFTKQLSRLRRRAGKVRDLDVQVAALRSVRIESGGRDKAILARHLVNARGKRERKLLAAIEDEISSGLRKRLERTAKLVLKRAESGRRKDFTVQALNKFKQLVEGHAPLTEENLHEFRMDCKRIRYLAEMSGDAPDAEKIVAALKRVQDAIGEWHDWVTLVETAEKVIANPTSPLIAALRARRQSKFHEALRITEGTKYTLLSMLRLHPAAKPVSAADGRPLRKGAQKVVAIGPGKADAAAG